MSGWTADDVARQTAKVKKTVHQDTTVGFRPRKYKNKPVEYDGIRFASKKEAVVYQQLKLREHIGEISHLQRQVAFPIYAYERKTGVAIPRATWIADFVYLENGHEVRVDAKGGEATKTQLYKLKKALLETQDGIPITEM